MSEQNEHKKPPQKQPSREERLKAALKANLGRRKAQARTRSSAQQEQTLKGDT